MIQETIVLRPDLRESLASSAQDAARTINDLVNEAVESYLEMRQNEILDREVAAYVRRHAELWRTLPGEWVAFHKQQLVDHDADQVVLYRRIRSKYGATPVLIRQVTENPVEEIWVRTPSTGRPSA